MKKIFVKSFYFLAVCLMFTGCEKKFGEGIALKDIATDVESIRIHLGDGGRIYAYPVPYDCTDIEFKFESSNTSVVAVDRYGGLVAKDVGNAVVTISNGNIRKDVQVEIYEVPLVEKLQELGAKACWQFLDANNLFKATIGPDLIPVGTGFEQIDGPNSRMKALIVPSSTRPNYNHLLYEHGFAANGGGSKVNEFTIVVDCRFPGDGGPSNENGAWKNGKYYSLYQADLNNSSDASFFFRPGADFGLRGWYTGANHLYVRDTWYRFVISVKIGEELAYFQNGVRQNTTAKGERDENRSWNLNGVLFFADEDGEDGQGFPLHVATLAVFDRALTTEEVRFLGNVFVPE